MDRVFFIAGSVLAFIGVGLGAFAAHALKGTLAPDLLATFEVGVRYQMYHALALLAAGWAWTRWAGKAAIAAGWLFVAGTMIFSGTLYAIALGAPRWLGAITPIGGVALLLGWLCLAYAAFRGTRKE